MFVASTLFSSLTAFAFEDSQTAGKSDIIGAVMPVDTLLETSPIDTEAGAKLTTTSDNDSVNGATPSPTVPLDTSIEIAEQTQLPTDEHSVQTQVIFIPVPCHNFTTLSEVPPMPSAPDDISTEGVGQAKFTPATGVSIPGVVQPPFQEFPVSSNNVTPAPSLPTAEDEPVFPAIEDSLDQLTTTSDETAHVNAPDLPLPQLDSEAPYPPDASQTSLKQSEETPEAIGHMVSCQDSKLELTADDNTSSSLIGSIQDTSHLSTAVMYQNNDSSPDDEFQAD
ncbi:uncharacterized protein PHALS_06796 [Plasmopara halstedii]|uniref:RxLR-like protein n=1 Tax=Plasmopara halstedii TaxID=4781 RepID=A0A0P1B3T7_PLAHL|nr:uncharacterized protein PHALS_06796 [Plasmopara halstedii]CEG49006.1 hypothetical protein PHALS_06796 [Plasmopara halstedii]|eukprot:XP_024585375.1 hypothetical protein PHALS_06796 [Plasmopara halstedii]